MIKVISILALTFLASCASSTYTEIKENQNRKISSSMNARLVEGDGFKLRVKKQIHIPFDKYRVFTSDGNYISLKNASRTDRHIPVGTVIDTKLKIVSNHDKYMSTLVTVESSSQIAEIVLNRYIINSVDVDSFSSAVNESLEFEIIEYNPKDLGKSVPIE